MLVDLAGSGAHRLHRLRPAGRRQPGRGPAQSCSWSSPTAMDPGLSTVNLQVEGGRSSPLQLRNGANRNVLLATVPPSLQPERRDDHRVENQRSVSSPATATPWWAPWSSSYEPQSARGPRRRHPRHRCRRDDASSEPSPSPSEAPDPGVVDPSGGPSARRHATPGRSSPSASGALGLLILAVGRDHAVGAVGTRTREPLDEHRPAVPVPSHAADGAGASWFSLLWSPPV